MTEREYLDRFWLGVRSDYSKLALLRYMADVVIERETDWDCAAIRVQMHDFTRALFSTECFVCGNEARVLNWHHVIQVQHGGSNDYRNFVAVCNNCHSEIHPWLPVWPEAVKGWYRVGGAICADKAQQTQER